MRVPVYNIQKIRELVLYGAMIAAGAFCRRLHGKFLGTIMQKTKGVFP